MGTLILNALLSYATKNPAVLEQLIEAAVNALIAHFQSTAKA